MSVCTQGHDPARAQTFLSRVRDGWRHLTLSLCCPLTSSHPAPWQPHHRSLGEPQEHFGGSGTQARDAPGTHWCQAQCGPDSTHQESFGCASSPCFCSPWADSALAALLPG